MTGPGRNSLSLGVLRRLGQGQDSPFTASVCDQKPAREAWDRIVITAAFPSQLDPETVQVCSRE